MNDDHWQRALIRPEIDRARRARNNLAIAIAAAVALLAIILVLK